MKKRFFSILLALFLCYAGVVPAFALEAQPRLVDQAGLLTASEASALEHQLDEISQRQQVDIVIVTQQSIGRSTPREFADDFYDTHSYREDGILLLICMEERDWYISTSGYGITAVTDAGLEYMSEQFVEQLSGGNYAEAFARFADLCDDFITQARTDRPYDAGNLPKEPFGVVIHLVIALAVGFAAALIATGFMRAQLKTVRPQPTAGSYVKAGSMHLTQSRDLFLYTHIDRREKPKETDSGGSSTHTSSSGTTHGGGGGKF